MTEKQSFWERAAETIKGFDIRDVHAYAGIILITIGAHQVYEPAGFIAPGALLCYIAFREVG